MRARRGASATSFPTRRCRRADRKKRRTLETLATPSGLQRRVADPAGEHVGGRAGSGRGLDHAHALASVRFSRRLVATVTTASMIRPYPVQRQMLPDSASRISLSVGIVAFEQAVSGHDEPGCAEPALHAAAFDERLLHVRQQAGDPGLGPDALDRDDRHADGRRRQHEARADERVVDEHAARAALALLASSLRAVQPEALTQHVEQVLAEPRPGPRGRRR